MDASEQHLSVERRIIETTLDSTSGVQKEAARLLGLKPTTLNEMIKRHRILIPRERDRLRLKEAGVKPVEESSVKPAPA